MNLSVGALTVHIHQSSTLWRNYNKTKYRSICILQTGLLELETSCASIGHNRLPSNHLSDKTIIPIISRSYLLVHAPYSIINLLSFQSYPDYTVYLVSIAEIWSQIIVCWFKERLSSSVSNSVKCSLNIPRRDILSIEHECFIVDHVRHLISIKVVKNGHPESNKLV